MWRKCLDIRKITEMHRTARLVIWHEMCVWRCAKKWCVTYKKLGVTSFCFNFVVEQVL